MRLTISLLFVIVISLRKIQVAGLRADTLRAFLCPLAKNARNGLQSVYPPEVSASREAPEVYYLGLLAHFRLFFCRKINK